jgi:hypothetical protein
MALKGAPHAFGIAEATFLGDGLDRQNGLFKLAARRIVATASGNSRPRSSSTRARARSISAVTPPEE